MLMLMSWWAAPKALSTQRQPSGEQRTIIDTVYAVQ